MASDSAPSSILSGIKEHASVAASLATVIGVFFTIGVFLLNSNDDNNDNASPLPSNTAVVVAALPTATAIATNVPVSFKPPVFSISQDANTGLPLGTTAPANDSVRVCPPQDLFAWVDHSLPEGTVMTMRWLNNDNSIDVNDIRTTRTAPTVWTKLNDPSPGTYTLRIFAEGKMTNWAIKVTC